MASAQHGPGAPSGSCSPAHAAGTQGPEGVHTPTAQLGAARQGMLWPCCAKAMLRRGHAAHMGPAQKLSLHVSPGVAPVGPPAHPPTPSHTHAREPLQGRGEQQQRR